MSKLGKIIVNEIKTSEYFPSDIHPDLSYKNTYAHLIINSTILTDTKLAFMLTDDWINQYFDLYSGGYSLNSDHDSVMFHIFNNDIDKGYESLPELDRSQVYLHFI
jgi:hypothetical protein